MADELVVVEQANIPALFQADGCDELLKRVKEQVSSFEPDISTATGRKEIASMANKVAKCKTRFDGFGKDLGDEHKKALDVINAERKKFRDGCDDLKKEVRKPLTDWEDVEKKRVVDIEGRIKDIENYVEQIYIDMYGRAITSEHLSLKLKELKEIVVDESFEEFELAATKAKESVVTQLEAKFIVLQNSEKEKAEADRLEKERLGKEQKEREEKIAKEAAEKATKEAEERAKKEAEEKEQKDKEEKDRLERETLQAKLDKEKAERETREAEDNEKRLKEVHQKELDDAASKLRAKLDRAEADKKQAIEDDRKRQEEAKRKEDEVEAKRQANKKHRKKINNEAKESLRTVIGCSEEEAERIIVVIAKGQISNVSINY